MLRFLVTPRAMSLHAALIVCVVAFGALAWWQWDRAQHGAIDPVDQPPVPVQELSTVGAPDIAAGSAGRVVTASGTYTPTAPLLVVPPAGTAGEVRILAPLRLDDGTIVAVVRGTADDVRAAEALPAPNGRVEVVGRLQPSDDLADPAFASARADEGRLVGVATSELVGILGTGLHPGWVAAQQETPGPKAPPVRLADSDLYLPDGGVQLRNAAYTVQWLLFAGFVVFVYRRFMLEAWRADTIARDARSTDAPDLTKENA